MALWPFRKRRKTKVAEGKKVAAPDPPPVERKLFLARKNSSRQNPRRTGSHHNPKDSSYAANNRVGLPEFPQPTNGSSSPIPIQDSFHPQKQPREGGFSSYFIEQNHSMSASSASSHRPHKPTSIVRKLSKRGRDRSHQPQPPSAYITQLARTASKRDKKRIRNFDELEDDRPMSRSSFPARDSINSSLSSQSSMRAYKVRNIFTPRPKLHYESSTGTSPTKSARLHPLTPSRSNSRSIRDGRHARAGITDEELLRGGRVDELADELDVHGIKEALDRDRRRKERKKKEDHEKLQKKLERRAAKQREQERMDREMGFEMDDDHFQRNLYSGRNYGAPEYQTGESSRSAGRAGFMLTPEPYPFPDPDDRPRDSQSPLSWIHDPSQEDINRAARSAQRVDMVTPVSMDSNRDTTGGPGYRGPEQIDSYKSTGPLAQPHESSHTGGTRHVDDYQPAFRGGFVVDDDDDMDRDGLDAGIDPGRGKASGWTSFLKKATAARMRKEQGTRGIRFGESVLMSDSEGEETHGGEPAQGNEFYEVDDLRKNRGQTPGAHIPDEVAFAMTALETGHVRGKDSVEAEKRGSFTPGRPLLPYSLHGRPSSSKSSLTGLPHRVPTSNPRSYLGSLDFGIDSPTLPTQPIRTSSTHSQNHYGRPSPTQRYSPSMHRHSLEAVGPDGRPRSLMSTSLASIDSEGSWLSGRVANPRGSINHISPLRTSATSLRRRYQEFDDNGSTNGDDYFSGVTPRRKRMENGGDEEMNGVTRLDLSDVEDSDEEGSVDSEAEKKMWRDGLGKKVVVTASGPPVDPKTAVLKATQASSTTATATTALSKDDQQSTTTTRQSWGPASEVEEFTTPMEHPYAQTYNNLEFKTPMEHPAASCAEFVGR
ncbi:hypothetical protein HOY82DRAFT_235985 [Tuber indicum]|nr:hypothetical protein HOY82DRAFT_235985 [Tuber indicum]